MPLAFHTGPIGWTGSRAHRRRTEVIVLPPTITATQVRTSRTATFVRQVHGRSAAEPVVLIHGNISSSAFFEPLMRLMPQRFRPLAVDLRGFGGSDPEPV